MSAGTLTLAGFAAALPFALSHLDSPDVTPGGTPSVTATSFMPENPLGLGCGDPVPPSLIDSPDRGEIKVRETAVEVFSASGGSLLLYPLLSPSSPGASTQVPGVYESHFTGVIVARDAAVVGWTDSIPLPGYMTWTSEGLDEPGGEVTTVVMNSAGIHWCAEAGGQAQSDGVPETGWYLTYPYIDPNSP